MNYKVLVTDETLEDIFNLVKYLQAAIQPGGIIFIFTLDYYMDMDDNE